MSDFPRPDAVDESVTTDASTVNVTNVAVTDDPNNPTDAITGLINYAPGVISETKNGLKSTEFWLVVLTAVLVQVDAIPLPEKWEGVVSGALAVAYALSRGLAKQGVPYVEAAKKEDQVD